MEYPDLYPVLLSGPRIDMREVGPDDAVAALAWASDPAFFRFSPHEVVTSEADEAAFLRAVQAQAMARPRRAYHLGIVWRDRGELIGMARIGISVPEAAGADIGYGVRRDCWNQGVATEAARLLVDFGFRSLGLHRIFAYHHPDNVASGRVLAKLGMHHEGRLRENMRSHGGWRDSMVWAILEQEWPAH
jgi:ribosomal-protein-alanine N-acetyltransferase